MDLENFALIAAVGGREESRKKVGSKEGREVYCGAILYEVLSRSLSLSPSRQQGSWTNCQLIFFPGDKIILCGVNLRNLVLKLKTVLFLCTHEKSDPLFLCVAECHLLR